MEEENDSIKEIKVYTKIKISDLPKGTNIISGKWLYKVKPTSTGKIVKYKSRIVTRGFQRRYGVDYTENYASVALDLKIRLILGLTVSMNLHLRGADINTAFLHADQIRPIYFKPPNRKGRIVKMMKSGCCTKLCTALKLHLYVDTRH